MPAFRHFSGWMFGCCLLAAAAGFALPALTAANTAAAPSPPPPVVSISDVKAGDDVITAAGPTAASRGQGTAVGRGKGTAATPTASAVQGAKAKANSNTLPAVTTVSNIGQTKYLITLRNISKIPAKKLAVEYHFYNLTSTTYDGSVQQNLTEITATEYVDIDPGKTVIVTTQPVPYEDTLNQQNTARVHNTSSTVTRLLGWHIDLRYNDKIITSKEDPSNLSTIKKDFED